MKKSLLCALLGLCLLFSTALADWTAPDANLAAYEKEYADEIESYKLIKYGAESDAISEYKQMLADLGYFPYRVSNNYYKTMEAALRVFAQQMRIGGDGTELTPLMQAMLHDAASLPKAISPAIETYAYSWEPDGRSFNAYTYTRMNRKSTVSTSTKVGFSGVIASATDNAGTWYYGIEMEDDPAKLIYVTYRPLPRTTVFQVGDAVSVFGATMGERTYPYPGMEEAAVTVSADRIGYSN